MNKSAFLPIVTTRKGLVAGWGSFMKIGSPSILFRSLCIFKIKRIVTESTVEAVHCPSHPSDCVLAFESGLIAVKFLFLNVRRVLQLTDQAVNVCMKGHS
jgi:hypothetical protein